ncbi:MAG: outer membrane protein OmpA-like peptidoglycan-associated protein [Bradymonadia bacterium]|jgi:outer membrane protein OmpA-like peptidoglycan-associated protein
MKLQRLWVVALFALSVTACGGAISKEAREDRGECRQGDWDTCIDLGDRHIEGDGVDEDRERAFRLYRRACRNNPDGAGCYELAGLASDDAGQSMSLEDVERILWKPCRRYDIRACGSLIELYENPEMSLYDPDHGQRVRDRLCEDGFDVYCGTLDTDGDGVPDDQDSCVLTPEDIDSWEDTDGCPEPDNDLDGLLDDIDSCPTDPEDMDGFEDEDGCPDPDNDGDGVLDTDDGCPDDAEDMDDFQDVDGCPELDNDLDGVLDTDDECPLDPEDVDGFEDADGCPEEGTGLVVLTCEQIEIQEAVFFETSSDVIQSRSFELLDQVAGVLSSVSYIRLIEIAGYTDDRGADDFNLELSEGRAASVMHYLSERGVTASRLRSVGFGEADPIADNGSSAGRAENRRVEFRIIEQDSNCGTALAP